MGKDRMMCQKVRESRGGRRHGEVVFPEGGVQRVLWCPLDVAREEGRRRGKNRAARGWGSRG